MVFPEELGPASITTLASRWHTISAIWEIRFSWSASLTRISSRMLPERVLRFKSATVLHSISVPQRSPSEKTEKKLGLALNSAGLSGNRSSGYWMMTPPSVSSRFHTVR